MTLIPFILDLADELNEFNRSLATATVMDVDDSFGFGIYAGEQPHHHLASSSLSQQYSSSSSSPPQHTLLSPQRRTRLATPLYWVPSSLRQRHHPYQRFGTKTACCNKSLFEVEKELAEKESAVSTSTTAGGGASGSGVGSGSSSAAGGSSVAKSSYSVVNKNGFQVSMNVKQFAPDELTVKTIDNCIVVEGQHDEKEDGHGVISRHFIRKYMLPKGYDPNQVLSTLSSDGILTVKAPPPPPPTPVVKAAEERSARFVEIQQTGGPAQILLAKDAQTPTKEQQATKPTTPITSATDTVVDQQQQQMKVTGAAAAVASSSSTCTAGGGSAAADTGDELDKQKSAGNDSERNGDAKDTPVTSVAALVATAEENLPQPMETSNGENSIAAQKEQKPKTVSLFEVPSAKTQLSEVAVAVGAADVVEPTSTGAVAAEDSTTNNTNNGLTAAAADAVGSSVAATLEKKPTTEDVEMTGADTTTTTTTTANIVPNDEAAEKLVASTTPISPPTPTKTGGELLAAADAAIIMAKTLCENGAAGADSKVPTEEVAN